MGVIPQEVSLYSFSLRQNLSLGRNGFDDERLLSACRIGGIDTLVEERGLDFKVGPRGGTVSGGERQRLGIARAVLADADLIVLDEATSDLDGIVEGQVLDRLLEARAGKTMVMIAHRLSTVLRADRICVLERGAVVDIGTHEELIGRCPRYGDLYQSQLMA